MADASPNFAIRQVQPQPFTQGVTPQGGTPIVAPISCTQVVIENTDPTNAVTCYTDPQNVAMTSKTIPPGTELTLRASVIAWGPNTAVCYVTAAASLAPCVVSYLR